MPLEIKRCDITKIDVEAVAFAKAVLGYDGKVSARLTEAEAGPGGGIPVRYRIFAEMPRFMEDELQEESLRQFYRSSLALAAEKGIRSIAFPLLPLGRGLFSRFRGVRIAADDIRSFDQEHEMKVFLVIHEFDLMRTRSRLRRRLDEYLEENLVPDESSQSAAEMTSPDYAGASAVMDDASAPAVSDFAEETDSSDQALSCEVSPSFDDEDGTADEAPSTGKPSAEKRNESRIEADRPSAGRRKESLRREDRWGGVLQTHKSKDRRESWSRGDWSEKAESSWGYGRQQAGSAPDAAGSAPGAVVGSAPGAASGSAPGGGSIEELERKLAERMKHLSDTFSEYLLYLIQLKGMTNAEVYKRAIVDKKVFSKIRNNPEYHPQKRTALCLCIGAKLSLDEAKDLLARAGYALSPCDKTDVIFSYFLEYKIYDMIELDIQLEEHGLPCIIE